MSYQTNTPVSEGLLHVHMFLAGCLLSWYLIGVDPMARRPDIRTALIVLFIAAAGHDILAKLLYSHLLPVTGGTSVQIQGGAQIMYYGGTLIEVLLAITVMTTWYRRGGRALRQHIRRARSRNRVNAPIDAAAGTAAPARPGVPRD